MDREHASEIAGPPALTGDEASPRREPGGETHGLMPEARHVQAVVEFNGVSKWYGNVIGLNRLFGAPFARRRDRASQDPNGAGKSTFLQLATGQT